MTAEGGPGNWTLSELMLSIGENRLEGEGRWGPSLAGEFRFELPEPATVYPQLEGSLEGTLSVAGTPEEPLGQLQVNGQAVRWGTAEADQLRLQAKLEQGLSLAAELVAEQLSAGGHEPEHARLQPGGSRGPQAPGLGAPR